MSKSAIPPGYEGLPPPWQGPVPEITEHDWRGVEAQYGPEPPGASPEERAWRERVAQTNAMLREGQEQGR